MRPIPLLAVLFLAGNLLAIDYFVAPTGNDANDGLAPNRALRTIQAGVNRLQAGDTLRLRGGVYRETVTFPHSGTADAPIVVRPYREEKVLVTGCDPVDGWALHDKAKGIWRAPMPWTLGLGRNQVFADGDLRIEARFPNTPDKNLGMYVSGLSPLWPTFGEFSIADPKENPARIVSKHLEGVPDDYWKGAIYYGIHYQGWAAQTGIVESSKDGEIIVGDRTKTWWFGSSYKVDPKSEFGRGMLVGHMHALDQPGEWCWQDGYLYLIPKTGKRPVNVEAKRRQLAFDLSGRAYIQIRDLSTKAASLRLQDSAHCLVDGCRMTYISHYRRHYAIGQIEHGKDTIKSGETGIFVGGHDNAFTNCSVRFSAGAGFYLRGYHHTIHNCLIDEISYTSHYLNAITDAVSDFNDYENFLVGGHVITYNTMRNAGRHFFNFYGNGTSTASRDRGPMDYMATLFAHNHLYNGMLQTRDAGFLTGYYSSGGTLDELNSQVVYNVMHDSYDLAGMRWGVLGIVYLDAGSCDVDLHHNLLWAAPGSHQRGLWYNTMCVDIHEHHNTFHPEFTRTCAELKPEDFPEGKPFRFGHDFVHPPPLPVWPQLDKRRIEAETCDARSERVQQTTSGLTGLQDGDWLCLGDVDFDQNWQSAVMRFASNETAMNSDRSARARPRHTKATDPLVMEVAKNDGLAEGIRRRWTFMYNVADGAWIRFDKVPLGKGYRRVRVIYGNDQTTPRRMEVHLDQADGPLVGTVDLPQTDRPRGGSIQIYAEATAALAADATGTHDIFLVFHSADGKPVGEFEYFRFEQYRGLIPLQKNEVKLELRLDRADGEKIGEFYPRSTGGPELFRDLVASLEPVSGTHKLFATVRSNLDTPIGTVDWVSLQKAHQPIDWTGVGNSPRRENGAFVYPEATNRPCAKPNDIYGKKATQKNLSRPLGVCRATHLTTPPRIDGKLTDWPVSDPKPTVQLTESYDGTPSAGPASQAWLGYDDQALYIAIRNPVENAGKLLPSNHMWGPSDGVEIAWQDGIAAKPGPILTLYSFPDGHFESRDYGGATPATITRLEKQVTYAAVVEDDQWCGEWRIPFAACDLTPSTAPILLFNIGVRKTEPDSWVVWRGTGGANYQVGQAGMLVLDKALAAWKPPAKGLAVWLDAADAATIKTDADGKVVSWQDKSGTSHHADQAAAAHRPVYRKDGLDGLPSLHFDEKTQTRLELPDLSAEKIDATAFVVFSNPEPGSEKNHDPRLFTASDGKGYDFQIGLAATIPGMQTGGPRQRVQIFKDRWAKQVRVGCFSPNIQTFLTGDIAEILVYDRLLSPQETNQIRAYLATKWQLP
jgi:hypothetical protein